MTKQGQKTNNDTSKIECSLCGCLVALESFKKFNSLTVCNDCYKVANYGYEVGRKTTVRVIKESLIKTIEEIEI